ncbi:DNA primase large subunit [Neolecta irregularis DAH-3]|uniref:DNA primase large subunit n=1 Tax=Neolecta irregularis (strain DAH-3) TaxID=1198029 RepID=A0A1U7LPL3_NEOID|nr:DNA primase large subunit [Neolecta irregularis DAH-3]|eukprot:OLL24461.1 DNA primase large subunit [Neolecta irregularis DAH-3]
MWRSQKKQSLGRKNFEQEVVRQTTYPHRLNFYIEPPRNEITLEDFELWAICRLHVLGEIESSLFRNKSVKEMDIILKPLIDKYLPLSSNTSRNSTSQNHTASEQERRKDHYSHFILRLAFCRSEELRRSFVRAEKELFRMRFQNEEARDRSSFISSLSFDWEIISEEEKKLLWDKLSSASQRNIDSETFFKVDFERVAELVEKRRVFVKGGQAYVPMSEQSNLVITEYISRLENALEITARALPRLDEDDRLIPILNHLSQGFTASEYSSPQSMAGEINSSQIDSLIQHYPLCMRNLHLNLRKDKHLKHYGRLQYGLFLKEYRFFRR